MINLLADFAVRFNVAMKRRVEFFYIPHSSLNMKLVELLFSYRCVRSFAIEADPSSKTLSIKIAPMFLENKPLIQKIELVSKPGLRIYWSAAELSKHFFRNNFQGFYVLSTPLGICTSNELIMSHTLFRPTGGEVLFRVFL
jgi:small subunit ribosomal protein S8